MSAPFLGEIRMFGFTFPPVGWALCNGQTLSISQNTALFSILGTTYGGNGVSTFALPNLQGQSAIGQGTGPGLTPIVVGETIGQNGVTLTTQNLPSHNHTLLAVGASPTTHSASGVALGTPPRSAPPIYAAGAPNTALAPNSIGLAGSAQPYSNLQPYLVVNFGIALQGIFPSRN